MVDGQVGIEGVRLVVSHLLWKLDVMDSPETLEGTERPDARASSKTNESQSPKQAREKPGPSNSQDPPIGIVPVDKQACSEHSQEEPFQESEKPDFEQLFEEQLLDEQHSAEQLSAAQHSADQHSADQHSGDQHSQQQRADQRPHEPPQGSPARRFGPKERSGRGSQPPQPAELDRSWIGPLLGVGRYVVFALQVLLALPWACLRPGTLIHHCSYLGVGALPLVIAAGASIGLVSWLQANVLLADFGGQSQLPGVVAIFVVIGVGPVLTALIVAGQVGARLGAELGSMTISEQVDALQALGMSPLHHLVTARVLSCVLMMPFLTVTLDYVALAASCLAEWSSGSVEIQTYFQRSLQFLTLQRVVPATASSVLFGFVVGVTGCWFGLRPGLGTEGVGRATTQSVVVSMFLILVTNVFWVRLTDLILSWPQ